MLNKYKFLPALPLLGVLLALGHLDKNDSEWPSLIALGVIFYLFYKADGHLIKGGVLVGLGFYGVSGHWAWGAMWVFDPTMQNRYAPISVAVIGVIALATGGVFGAIVRVIKPWLRGDAVGNALMMAAAWSFTEWLTTLSPFGGTWYALGYLAVNSAVSENVYALGGVYLQSVLYALLSAAIMLILNALTERTPPKRSLGVAPIFAIVYGLYFVPSAMNVEKSSQTPTAVTIIQPALRENTFFTYLELAKEVDGKSLVIIPEGVLNSRQKDPDQFYQANIAEHLDGKGVYGVVVSDEEKKRYVDFVRLDKKTEERYTKRILTPMMERNPFSNGISGHSRPSVNPVFAYGETSFGAFICLDAINGNMLRAQAGRAGFLVSTSNDSWSGSFAEANQHFKVNRVRAIELGRPIVRIGKNGVSGFIDIDGSVNHKIGFKQTGVFTQGVASYTGKTMFVRWGNAPFFLALLIIAMVIASRRAM